MNEQETEATSMATRIVRCTRTNRYWDGKGWTGNSTEAANFYNEIDAVRACVDNNLRDIELVLRQPGTGVDLFATPIR